MKVFSVLKLFPFLLTSCQQPRKKFQNCEDVKFLEPLQEPATIILISHCISDSIVLS